MRKIKEYYICDRCKKEISEEEVNKVFDYNYFYDLCNKCKKIYDEYNKKVDDLKKSWEELDKKYKFGEYIPKEEDIKGEII